MRQPAPPPEPPDANRIVRSVPPGWSAPVSADVVDDCRLEACLALWSIWLRIQALPPDQRCPYATACIQHAVRRYLIREGRPRCGAIPMDGLGCLSARAVASAPDFTFEQELM